MSRRLRLIAMYRWFYTVSKVHLGDFVDNDQWIILSYAIVYETIGYCIYKHILLAVKFYAYVHSGTIDEFVVCFREQSMIQKDLSR